jgi:hypothetical protein
MSHHLDSALARQDPRLDITDVFVFRGETGTVFVMDLNSSILGDGAPRGFHPEALYAFRIDLDGDAVEDLTFCFVCEPRDVDGRQAIQLRCLRGAEARDPAGVGTLLAAGTTDRIVEGADGLRLWAGLAADPFYIDATVLKVVGAAFRDGTAVSLSASDRAAATNLFAGTNIHAIVLEVPDSTFDGLVGADQRIGVWGTTHLATDDGGWRPINRAGLPMIQPIFNPSDSERASAYNTTRPSDDRAVYGPLFAGLVASVVAVHETADDPAAYGAVVTDLLLPDILPYRIGSVASFSFAVRNGRTLTDNAPDVMLSLATNSPLAVGLSRRSASSAPRDHFPYLAAPVRAAQPAVTA